MRARIYKAPPFQSTPLCPISPAAVEQTEQYDLYGRRALSLSNVDKHEYFRLFPLLSVNAPHLGAGDLPALNSLDSTTVFTVLKRSFRR